MSKQRPIFMETTEISAERTAGEITSLLVAAGARQIAMDYGEGGKIVGMHFTLLVGGLPCVMPAEMVTYRSIRLTPGEVCLAGSHALMRRRAKLLDERRDREQGERSTWDNEMEGSCAEMAFCKYRQIYWTGVSGLRARDGGAEAVRWTGHSNGGLIIYPRDPDDRRPVLLDGRAPVFRIVGWLYACEGKLQKRFDEQTGYFLVPRQNLRPYEEA